MTAITRRISEFAAGIAYDARPPEVVERTGMLVMDNVGIALRARHDADSTTSLIKAAGKLGLDNGSSVAIGDRRGFSPLGAARGQADADRAR